ncbi:hypothetical protein SAMN05421505_12710 [Sinosporangium album]|uniref:PknH-like extracellular domain-containing protein n=1 Tax=Sinosporangium album TaxID=504805 RepID=A0A1G8GEY3_9ACTN|nr:hypothetical protein [Sinosporangium album]SDH92928.1 hypothetical protein SAMN05421505_12710 [Sinosporangium album]
MKKVVCGAAVAAALLFGSAAVSPAAASTASVIPKGFLLYENKAVTQGKKDPEHQWTISNRLTAVLGVNPCNRRPGKHDRAVARTISYVGVPDFQRVEQVIVYADSAAAATALKEVRTALSKCRSVDKGAYRFSSAPVKVGDEAVRVTGQAYQGGKVQIHGERAVVARRGNAVAVYSESGEWGPPRRSDFKSVLKDAKTMMGKICTVAVCR